jgi:hypothetical protein
MEDSFPFPFLVVDSVIVSCSVGADVSWSCDTERGSVLVALFLTGLLNAFLIFLTLTCPNPGRFRNWSGLALEMFEKLFIHHLSTRLEERDITLTPNDVRSVSTSVLLTLPMLVKAVRSIEL